MKAYKGFNKDMTCRGFKYEEGKSYETDRAEICGCGFHACENPLECFDYYGPSESVYHEVELDGEIVSEKGGTKVASTRIKIGPGMTMADVVRAGTSFVLNKADASPVDHEHVATSGAFAHAATSGDCAYAATSGECSNAATAGGSAHAATSGVFAHAATSGVFAHAATSGAFAHAATSGDCAFAATAGGSANAATSGDRAHAATSGDRSNAATSGDRAHAATSGDGSDATTSGVESQASASGYLSNAAATGDFSNAEVKGKNAIAAVLGANCMARGAIGCWLVLTERDGEKNVLGVKAIRIDGFEYKPDTWYALRDGKVVKVEG